MPSVTRTSQAGRQDRRESMERRLFEATEHLVSEGASFTELSVERLAAQAGISRSTFYVHFQDKGDLARKLTRTVLTARRGRWAPERGCSTRTPLVDNPAPCCDGAG